MNQSQEIWWRQARSDHELLVLLRRQGAPPCHQLHYLQMTTEKLAKAYFWRCGAPPSLSHAGFVQYLRSLGSAPTRDRQRVATVFGFKGFGQFQNWIRSLMPLAYELERLAPALAADGPNSEYPWPQRSPKHAPVNFEFKLWRDLTNTGRGRDLIRAVAIAVERFTVYS